MALYNEQEELLRADLIAAKKALDGVLIRNHKRAKKEATLVYEAAFAKALRRFSDFVLEGKLPEDLAA
jgi:hypothetical protein